MANEYGGSMRRYTRKIGLGTFSSQARHPWRATMEREEVDV